MSLIITKLLYFLFQLLLNRLLYGYTMHINFIKYKLYIRIILIFKKYILI